MTKIVLISIIVLSLLLYICFLATNLATYKRIKNTSYSFLNHFPDELITRGRSEYTFSFFLQAYFFFSIIGAIFYLPNESIKLSVFSSLSGLLYSIIIFQLIETAFLYAAVIFLPIGKDNKNHLLSFFIGAFAMISKIVLLAILSYKLYFNYENDSLGFFFIYLVVLVVLMLLIVNPKLANWFKLKTKLDECGEVITYRDKAISLAYTEWIFLFSNLLINIVSYILVICFK